MNETANTNDLAGFSEEQLPVAPHKLHGWKHFLGLYAGEHVAATEFVIGATFVALGVKTMDILIGLLIGNVLAILSWTLITAPIATQTRLRAVQLGQRANLYGDLCRDDHRVGFGGAVPVQYTGSIRLVPDKL